jgi:hypothetical protein
MGKRVNRDREKILSKADIKANNILKAVEAYEAEGSDLLLVSTPRINTLPDWSLRRGAPKVPHQKKKFGGRPA